MSVRPEESEPTATPELDNGPAESAASPTSTAEAPLETVPEELVALEGSSSQPAPDDARDVAQAVKAEQPASDPTVPPAEAAAADPFRKDVATANPAPPRADALPKDFQDDDDDDWFVKTGQPAPMRRDEPAAHTEPPVLPRKVVSRWLPALVLVGLALLAFVALVVLLLVGGS